MVFNVRPVYDKSSDYRLDYQLIFRFISWQVVPVGSILVTGSGHRCRSGALNSPPVVQLKYFYFVWIHGTL